MSAGRGLCSRCNYGDAEGKSGAFHILIPSCCTHSRRKALISFCQSVLLAGLLPNVEAHTCRNLKESVRSTLAWKKRNDQGAGPQSATTLTSRPFYIETKR